MLRKWMTGLGYALVLVAGCLTLGGFRPAWAAEEVTFAMLPQITNAAVFKKWEAMLKQVAESADVQITQVFPKDFDEHTQWCLDGRISIAYSNPVIYAQVSNSKNSKKQGHQAFAIAATPNGTRDFYGLFIVRADNTAIQRIADLKGRRGIITGWTSAGGYIFQRAFALDQGLNLSRECQLVESEDNKQEKVVMAVYNQEADFGLVRNGMLKEVENRIDLKQIRVLAETPKYPAWVLSTHASLKPKTAARLAQAFLALPGSMITQAKLPGSVTGFVAAQDKEFDDIRKVLVKIGMNN